MRENRFRLVHSAPVAFVKLGSDAPSRMNTKTKDLLT